MDINITVNADGTATVRTSVGGIQNCTDENQAVTYAHGLQDGYEAARLSLPKCHGFRIDRKEPKFV